MRGAAHRVLHDEALRLGAQFVGRARHSGIRHVKNCHLGGRQDISVLVSGDHRRFSGAESGSAENRPCPAGRRFCKQAWCPPSLAGVSAGQRGAHATCAVCPHAPHWLRCCLRAKWSLLARLRAGVFTCKVFLRCRDTHSAWRDDFCQLAWGAVQSSDSTWSGSTFFAPPSCAPAVAVSVVYPSLLQPRWFT